MITIKDYLTDRRQYWPLINIRIGNNVDIGSARIFENASIGNHVKIGKRVNIFGGVKIQNNCVIGTDVSIHERAVIYHHVKIDNYSTILSGAIIPPYSKVSHESLHTLYFDLSKGKPVLVDNKSAEVMLGNHLRGTRIYINYQEMETNFDNYTKPRL